MVLENILWLVRTRDEWLELPLKELDNATSIPDNKIQSLMQSIIASEKALDHIVNMGKYENKVTSFISNNTRYYWIDISLFP